MASPPVGFPVPQMQEGLDEREALDCFILDYIDYCTVMGWFRPKAGCKYDEDSEQGAAQWKKPGLCMSTLRATLPPKMKRLINPSNKTLELPEEDKSNPVKVLQALVKRFGGSVSVQAERTKMCGCFKMKAKRSIPGNVGSLSEPSIVNMVTLRIKLVGTVSLLV